MNGMLRSGRGLALLILALALPNTGSADVDWHGFAEGAYGVRVSEVPAQGPQAALADEDYTLEETRVQLTASAFGDVGRAFARLDVLHDGVADGQTELLLREGYLQFTTLWEKVDVKAGRQALTWGTGDLIFINDLFPKDWVSFFSGREDQYLKAPADAIRLGAFGLPMNLDLVVTPRFTPDVLPQQDGRLAFTIPANVGGPAVEPTREIENGEVALRLSRYVGNFTAALYGYRGFFKTPVGAMPVLPSPGSTVLPYYPKLAVYGASLRGSAVGGILWLEGGYYDSREDRDGDSPFVPNSSLRYLAGYERQLLTDFNVGMQYYGEKMMKYGPYETSVGAANAYDEFYHLLTLRAEKMLHYQLVRLSLFSFYSPTDEDTHVRALASYKVTDDVSVAVGANIFTGDDHTTQFGQFDRNDNVFTRLRYSF
jgi:hypothetical protein